MFWRKSDRDILEAPRSSEARKLDARSYEPLPDQDAIAAETAAHEARQAEEEAASAYTDRFDDALIRFTNRSEKVGSGLWAFFLRQEAKRYASPRGDLIGLAWAAVALIVVGGIGTWIFGWRFWMYLAFGAIYFSFSQMGVGNADDDFSDADPTTLFLPRRIAVFYHHSFATAEGTIRNLWGIAIVSGIMAILLANIS